jgi:hypothetical protein
MPSAPRTTNVPVKVTIEKAFATQLQPPIVAEAVPLMETPAAFAVPVALAKFTLAVATARGKAFEMLFTISPKEFWACARALAPVSVN